MASKLASPNQLTSIFRPVIYFLLSNYFLVTDLAGVLNLLRRHGYSGVSYYDLGLYLGLSSDTLDAIKENNKGDIDGCLRDCLTKWLQEPDEEKGGPTIYLLVTALRELGENAIAERIDIESELKQSVSGLAGSQTQQRCLGKSLI